MLVPLLEGDHYSDIAIFFSSEMLKWNDSYLLARVWESNVGLPLSSVVLFTENLHACLWDHWTCCCHHKMVMFGWWSKKIMPTAKIILFNIHILGLKSNSSPFVRFTSFLKISKWLIETDFMWAWLFHFQTWKSLFNKDVVRSMYTAVAAACFNRHII